MSKIQFEILQNDISKLQSDFKQFMEIFSKAFNMAMDEKIEESLYQLTKKVKELEARIAKIEQNHKK